MKNITIALATLILGTATANGADLDAYVSAKSVIQGQDITVHVSTIHASYDLEFRRLGQVKTLMDTVPGLPGSAYPLPVEPWHEPLDWPVAYTLSVPPAWPSGIYEIKVIASPDVEFVTFTVREDQPASVSPVLLLDNAANANAYNGWGGKSLYATNSTDEERSTFVAFRRPPDMGQDDTSKEQKQFLAWAEHEGIGLEFASMLDLHADPQLLDPYTVLVIAGHSEYWSLEMRNNLHAWLQNGGNAMILGGNTMWWQVRIEGDKMICYKRPETLDPLYGIDDARVTTNWFRAPVNNPENTTIGLSWRKGGFVNHDGFLMAEFGYGGYTVEAPEHWVFDGTGLSEGEIFGYADTIVGYEVDGAVFDTSTGRPVVTGSDGTPLDFQILATSPAETANRQGNATMGVFSPTPGNYVFNAATIDWADGLWTLNTGGIPNATVSLITHNVLDRMLAPDDSDADQVPDPADNCVNTANTDQQDTDGDSIGNACDADLDGDCVVNFTDLGLIKNVFFDSGDLAADFNGDAVVNFDDLAFMKSVFFAAPGPSGLPNACDGN